MPPRLILFLAVIGLWAVSTLLLQRYSIGEVLLLQLAIAVIVAAWFFQMRRHR